MDRFQQAVVVHAFNTSMWDTEWLSEASLLHRASSRTVRFTKRNPVSNNSSNNNRARGDKHSSTQLNTSMQEAEAGGSP